jgi:hypothetical protein
MTDNQLHFRYMLQLNLATALAAAAAFATTVEGGVDPMQLLKLLRCVCKMLREHETPYTTHPRPLSVALLRAPLGTKWLATVAND